MAEPGQDDKIWQSAVDWVMREHEQALDPDARGTLHTWLAQDPAHHVAYEKASHIWLLTGLLPPAGEEYPSALSDRDEYLE